MVDNTLVIERYQSQGFEGFIKLSEFEKDANKIPNGPGLFMIIDFDGTGEFLETGGGAFFKGRNPNKPVNELKELWVNDSQVLLIEKASFRFKNQGLRKKISRLIKFCKGQPTGPFYNGRSLAQRSNFNNLTVAWLCLESSLVKEQYNNALIDFIQNILKPHLLPQKFGR
ncbi:MAG: hypothetical protein IPQ08_09100 [Chitinophagaceae bacterium]|nr:hypothetical protein [Chitinophagaceae bacterium]